MLTKGSTGRVEALGGDFPVVPASEFEPLLAEFTAMPSNETCDDARCRAYHETVLGYPSAFRRWWMRPEDAWADAVRWDTTGGVHGDRHEGP